MNPNDPSEMPIEEIRKRIVSRLGIEEDELKTLYPTDDRLREFYLKEVLTIAATSHEDDDWPEDNYKLKTDGAKELAGARRRVEEKARFKQEVKAKVKDEREKLRRGDEFGPAEQSHLPAKERVSLKDIADAAASLKDLNLDSDDEEGTKTSA